MNVHETMLAMGDRAVTAARAMVSLDTEKKNAILNSMAVEIDRQRKAIKTANKRDMEAGVVNGLAPAMLDRLELSDKRIDGMIEGIVNIVSLRDPVHEILNTTIRPNGLEIRKVRVPIGVIGIIYESRPNVTADAAALCIKSSNAVILRGGSESIHSNRAIAEAMQSGGAKQGLPEGAVQLVSSTDREAVREMVQMEGRIDLIIPRGGEGLIRAVAEMSRIPVLKHYKGVCHTYVDESADVQQALDICENAKCQRPGVCNAMETLLIHENIAAEFLPQLAGRLKAYGVELRGDQASRNILQGIKEAGEEDWYAEYLDLILAIRVMPNLQAAVDHINTYGSQHSDAIVTSSESNKNTFIQHVDSATVYVNASTRFTDGGEFGMGAEMGISTDKLHARGPVGMEELTTYKYQVYGSGQIRT